MRTIRTKSRRMRSVRKFRWDDPARLGKAGTDADAVTGSSVGFADGSVVRALSEASCWLQNSTCRSGICPEVLPCVDDTAIGQSTGRGGVGRGQRVASPLLDAKGCGWICEVCLCVFRRAGSTKHEGEWSDDIDVFHLWSLFLRANLPVYFGLRRDRRQCRPGSTNSRCPQRALLPGRVYSGRDVALHPFPRHPSHPPSHPLWALTRPSLRRHSFGEG